MGVLSLLLPFAALSGPAAASTGIQGYYSRHIVVAKDTAGQLTLGPFLDYLEDPNGRLTISQVNSPGVRKRFRPCSRPAPGFGFTSSVYWFRFSLKNPYPRQENRYLEIEYPLLDHVELYEPLDNGSYRLFREGDRQEFSHRPVLYRNFVFILKIPARTVLTYFIRVKTSSSLNMPAKLYTPAAFIDKVENEDMALGMYLGILFAMLAYNMILYVTIKESIYLHYVLFVIFNFFFQLGLTGVSFKYLWPSNPYWANISLPFFIFTAFFFGTKFTRGILNTPKNTRLIDKLLEIFLALAVAGAIISLLVPYNISIKLATIFIITVVVHIAAGFLCLYRGYRPARYYALAWTVSLAGMAIFALKSFGTLPNNFITIWGIQIGSAWEVILLSIALADRINMLSREKEQIQAEYTSKLEAANLNLEEFTKTLEEKVAQRTSELEESNLLLKKQAQEMRRAEEKAERASRAKSDFLANMSHEIRTPLNAITGITGLALEMEDLPPKLRDYLKVIKASAYSLLSLVNDILDFSKIEAGRMELENTEFNLQDVIETIADMFSEQASEKGTDFIIDMDPEMPEWFKGDPVRLGQMLTNLVSNALKFTEKGEVVLSCSCRAMSARRAFLEFNVEDTGIGIEPARLEILFDMFTQADSSTTRRFGGTGLGLAICKKIADLMGGDIRVSSRPGEGTKFVFSVWFETVVKAPRTASFQDEDLPAPSALICCHNGRLARSLANMLKSLGLSDVSMISRCRLDKAMAVLEDKNLLILDTDDAENGHVQISDAVWLLERFPCLSIIACHGFGSDAAGQMHAPTSRLHFILKPVKKSVFAHVVASIFHGQDTSGAIHGPQRTRRAFTGTHILLVEDNEVNQLVAREILEKLGSHVTIAKNGKEALAALVDASFDLVLMDIQMPEMDGYETTKALRARKETEQVPVVAMTAGVFKDDRQRCFEAGMNDFLMKPVTPESISRTLEKWIKQESRQDLEAPGPAHEETPDAPALDLPASFRGIDAPDLRSRFSSMDFLLEVARKFAAQYKDFQSSLERQMESCNLENCLFQVHALKGAAGNLSAYALQKRCVALEDALKSRDLGRSPVILKQVQEQIDIIIESLESCFPAEKDDRPGLDSNEGKAASNGPKEQEIQKLFTDLDELLALNDIESEVIWETLKTRLGGTCPVQELEAIDSLLIELDFEEARLRLNKIRKSLN